MACAFKFTKNSYKVQFDHIQLLVKEVATIKSNIHVYGCNLSIQYNCIYFLGNIHMFINQNDNQQIMKSDEINTISFNPTYLEIYKKLIETLELENNTLHKNLHQILKNDIKKHTNK